MQQRLVSTLYCLAALTAGAAQKDDTAAYAANFVGAYDEQQNLADQQRVFIGRVLLGLYQTKPTATSQEALSVAYAANNWLQQRRPEQQFLMSRSTANTLELLAATAAGAVGKLDPLGIASPFITTAAKQIIEELRTTPDPGGQAQALTEGYDRNNRARELLHNTGVALHRLARQNPQAATAIDAWMTTAPGTPLRARTTQSAAEVMSANPSRFPPELLAKVQANQPLTQDQLLHVLQAKLTDVTNGVQDTLKQLKDLNAQQSAGPATFAAYVANTIQRQAEEAATQRRQQLWKDQIANAQATASFISELVDPKVGRSVRLAVATAVQTYDAVDRYTRTTAALGESGKLLGSALATAGLMSNFAAIGMQMADIFSETGPTQNEIILQELAHISEQIRDVKIALTNRLNRIEEQLVHLSDALDAQFAKFDFTLGLLRTDVNEIRAALIGVQADANRLERSLFAFATDLSKAELLRTMSLYLGYRSRTGRDLTFEQYVTAESILWDYARREALNQTLAGPDRCDTNLFAELTNYPLVSRLNCLNVALAQLGVPAPSASRLANPIEWAVATDAWMQLATENPAHAKQLLNDRSKDLHSVGARLQQFIAAITTTPDAKANRRLFDALIANYDGSAKSIAAQGDAKIATYLNKPSLQGFDLWTAVDSLTAPPPPITQLYACDGRTPGCAYGPAFTSGTPSQTMSVPAGYLDKIPSILRVAHRLQLGQVKFCARAEWVKTGECCCGAGFGGKLKLLIDAKYNDSPFRTWAVTSEENYDCRMTREDPMTYFSLCNYDRSAPCCRVPLRAKFEDPAQVTETNYAQQTQIMEAARAAIEQFFQKERGSLYAELLKDAQLPGTFHDALERLTTAKLLIDATVAIGMSQLRQTDDLVPAYLNGNGPDRLPDGNSIRGVLAAAADGTVRRVDITQLVKEKSSGLAQALTRSLDDIEQGRILQPLDLVDRTMRRLVMLVPALDTTSPPACAYSVTPPTLTFSAAGGSAVLTVTASSAPCAWGLSLPAFLRTSQTGALTGSGSLTVIASANTAPTAINGAITIGGVSIPVVQQGASPTAPLAITNATALPAGSVNHQYATTLTATGGKTPYRWSATGQLPPSITLTDGKLTGTPTTAGAFRFTLTLTDSTQAHVTKAVELTIAGPTAGTGSHYGVIYAEPTSAVGTFQYTEAVHASGTQAGMMTYDFKERRGYILFQTDRLSTQPREVPQRITCMIYGDGSGHKIAVRVYDTTDERFVSPQLTLDWVGWRTMTFTNPASFRNYLGDQDHQFDPPPSRIAIELTYNTGKPASGKFYVDDIQLEYPKAGRVIVEDFEHHK